MPHDVRDLARGRRLRRAKSDGEVKPLGFGGADLVVAVPQSWIDVETMSDLAAVCAGMREALEPVLSPDELAAAKRPLDAAAVVNWHAVRDEADSNAGDRPS